ncbi:MAG TPA: ribonuclease Z [Nitrososphaera sp.]|jgi:ribonuclease Z|nr:ribonuclease Z [Nitrososphaera sp.]
MQLVFLGTSSAAPTVERGLSSIALMRGSELLLFDAGEGMQRNFIKAGLGMNRKMKIFISHMHADHCVGLLGLLQTMALQGRERSIDIYGEPRVKEFWEENRRIIDFGLTFDVQVHTIEKEGVVVKEGEYQVACCEALHSIPSLAYCLEEFDRPGEFDVKEAKRLGIPEGELYSKLQHGQDIVYKGKKIKSSQIVGQPRKGRKIGISGDTRPTDKLAKFFRGCDVLVFESTYSHDKQQKAIENWHSTATEAATIAKKAGAGRLFLTHFSARYDETSSLVKEAGAIHGNVEAAEDLKAVEIPYA